MKLSERSQTKIEYLLYHSIYVKLRKYKLPCGNRKHDDCPGDKEVGKKTDYK
jgi:hypothetical protein